MPGRYRDVGHVRGRWGRAGSGVLFVSDRRILLLLRAPWVMEPRTWGIPGGAIPEDQHGLPMHPLTSALREAREEIGPIPPHRIVDEFTVKDRRSGFRFTTYIARVDGRFAPALNNEHDDYVWWDPKFDPPLRLHPGVEVLLANRRWITS